METLNPTSTPTKTKLSQKLQKFIHLKTTPKTLTIKNVNRKQIPTESNSTATEVFVAKLFATISVLKAAYAELQTAQFPYNADLIESADKSVISELTALSELKEKFKKNEIDSLPHHVTLLLSEIQEQQSLMKMYEITISKMESEIEAKKSEYSSVRRELNRLVSKNKSIEKKLKSSTNFNVLDGVRLLDPDMNAFIKMLNYTIRSVRNFVKLLMREMEYANWNIKVAAKSIEPDAIFNAANDICFVFESFVCSEMFDRFDTPNFGLQIEQTFSANEFNKLKSANSIEFLKNNRCSIFAEFVRSKYLCLVPEKMEASFSGNLNRRKMISAGEYPETVFFHAFVEMARRVWILHCLGFCFVDGVRIFQVRKKCRFSEVHMEDVTGGRSIAAAGVGSLVAFTVVPGFKMGRTVIQSQVYLSPGLI
ncbi:hypothetical protein LguiA_014807 [Lonicera macranthoides]